VEVPSRSLIMAAGRLREPVVDAGEEREDRPRRHDVVEVADDVVGVVQVDVGRREPERQAGQPADAEHRQEGEREEHRRVKRIEPPHSERIRQVRMTTDGIEMIIVVVWKKAFIAVPMPVRNMWCAQTMKDRKPSPMTE
jgi:hypothetical protein